MKKMNTNTNCNCKLSFRSKKSLQRLLSIALVMALFCSLNLAVFAAEPELADVTATEVTSNAVVSPLANGSVVRPMSVYGYAAYYTDAHVDSFTVNAPGTSTSTGAATIKAWDFNSDTVVYVTIVRPDGTTAKADVKLTGNMETTVTFSKSLPGNYTIHYYIPNLDQGWLATWIFSK